MNFDKSFKSRILSREEWAPESVMRDYAVTKFRDGSKTETGTNSGEFSDDLNFSMSHNFSSGDLRNVEMS